MRKLSSFSYSVTGGILMVLYSLFLLQFVCVLLTRKRGQKILLLLTGLSVVVLRVYNERPEFGFFPSAEHKLAWLERLPLWSILLYTTVLGAITFRFVWLAFKTRPGTLDRSSIKESFDNLPTGLCFSTSEGFVLLANRKMEELCLELTGRDLQDAGNFWRGLTEHPEEMKATQLRYGEQPCFCLENQEIWTFQQDFLHTETRPVFQLMAVNITELYQLLEKLKENHSRLEKMNDRLKQYHENMESYVRSREILDTKMCIHKEIGQALLASRAYIHQDIQSLTEEEILNRWKYVVLLLKKEAEPTEHKNMWTQFVNAGREAGVQILVSGKLPLDPVQQEYLLMTGVEALTNAVRHGGADQLSITITERKDGRLQVSFSNNGKSPSGQIQEGGGLSALRIRLEEAGGSMEIRTEPKFCLSAVLPPKGGLYDTDTGSDRRR